MNAHSTITTPPSLCPRSHMSFTGAVASQTSHRERKVGTSLFSSLVWLCANDVEGKHCAPKRKERQGENKKREGKTRGRKEKKKVGKVVRSEGPCCPCILHLFCIWLHHQSDPFSFPPFLMLLVQIFMQDLGLYRWLWLMPPQKQEDKRVWILRTSGSFSALVEEFFRYII